MSWYDRKCKSCGEKLGSSLRSDAKFCNANCRKAYSRRKETFRAMVRDTHGRIDDVAGYLGSEDLDMRARNELMMMREKITALLNETAAESVLIRLQQEKVQ